MHRFKDLLLSELYDNIIPFWSKLKDDRHGGFIGYVDNDGKPTPDADKGSMLQMRIAWFFAKLCHYDAQPHFRDLAMHAFDYVKRHLMDDDGGIVWSTDYQGKVKDSTKHIYYQSFGLYATCQHYQSFGDPSSLAMAHHLFNYIEKHFRDAYGYKEQLDHEENRIADLGIRADRTMNAILHLAEAYTAYHMINPSEDVQEALKRVLDLFIEKIYNRDKKRLEVLFDHQMVSIADYHSYGHDIEASWLLEEAANRLNDPFYRKQIESISDDLCASIYVQGMNRFALKTDRINDVEDERHVWWVQAEGVVGFYKNAQRTHKPEYFHMVQTLLEYIRNHQRNPHAGEWYWRLDKDHMPDLSTPLVSNWKCPYHNGRMCIELLEEMKS